MNEESGFTDKESGFMDQELWFEIHGLGIG